MSELNDEILSYLDKNSNLDTYEYAKANQLDHQKVVGAIKSLQTNEGVSKIFSNKMFFFRLQDGFVDTGLSFLKFNL